MDRRTNCPPSSSLPSDFPRGVRLLHDPLRNKGTAFSGVEREALSLRGLLPPRIHDQDTQVVRVMENLRRKTSNLEKFIFLISLQDRNETLFYRVVIYHIQEIVPLIYTPTVGEACQLYGHIFRRPRGLWVSNEDRGRVAELLRNWPHEDVRVIVVTDGERILGLGDLGADGMGIPVGKLSLYTACAGVPPEGCLPITIDVGTDNVSLLEDPLYIGLPHQRVRGAAYLELLEEFVTAVSKRFPQAIIQFEDFATANAFSLLEKYRDRVCCFNDDIQGTGSMALAGIYSALRITGGSLSDQRFLFLGAGEAGVGIGNTIVPAMVDEGMSVEEARSHCWFFDSRGLVVQSRSDLAPHKLAFAHDHDFVGDFLNAVNTIRPSAIIGVSAAPGSFTRPVLEAMATINHRPIIFALSNPTSRSECTAEEAYSATDGRAVFASGSPFGPVTMDERTLVSGQGNNAFIFPGLGLGLMVAGASRVTDEMFFVAAKALANQVTEDDINAGTIYPSLSRIRDVSANIATAVAEVAYAKDLARNPRPECLPQLVRGSMYQPTYGSYVEP